MHKFRFMNTDVISKTIGIVCINQLTKSKVMDNKKFLCLDQMDVLLEI